MADAIAAGFDLDQIWSVVHGEDDSYLYGPSHDSDVISSCNYVLLLGYVATTDRHDGDTYYIEVDE